MLTFEFPTTINVEFTCRKKEGDVPETLGFSVDLSDMDNDSMLEWACNNGIIVYLQGQWRKDKIKNGDTIKLHKPGTRSASIPVSDEDYNRIRPNLEAAGILAVDTSRADAEKIIRTLLKQIKKTVEASTTE